MKAKTSSPTRQDPRVLEERLLQRTAELAELAYITSHDLAEPLRMVTSYLTLLEKRYGRQLDEKAEKNIFYAVDGAHRMGHMVEALLSYSQVTTQAAPLEVVDVSRVVDQSLAGLKPLMLESRAEVRTDKLPELAADPKQLVQVFTHLIENSLKYRSEQPPEVQVAAQRRGDGWEFSVADNGIGIAPESYERIFRPLRQLHQRGEYAGTGVGLALAKKIVERHGGRLWLESSPGNGSTFYFTLPARSVEAV